MVAAISTAFTQFIAWFAELVSALVGAEGSLKDLLPIMAIGIAVSLFGLCFKWIRRLIWGA